MFPGDCVHQGNGSEDLLEMEGSLQGVNILLSATVHVLFPLLLSLLVDFKFLNIFRESLVQ